MYTGVFCAYRCVQYIQDNSVFVLSSICCVHFTVHIYEYKSVQNMLCTMYSTYRTGVYRICCVQCTGNSVKDILCTLYKEQCVQDMLSTLYKEQCVQYTWKNEAVGAGGCLCSRILIGLGTV